MDKCRKLFFVSVLLAALTISAKLTHPSTGIGFQNLNMRGIRGPWRGLIFRQNEALNLIKMRSFFCLNEALNSTSMRSFFKLSEIPFLDLNEIAFL